MSENFSSLKNLSTTENILNKLSTIKKEVSDFIETNKIFESSWKTVGVLQKELKVNRCF